MQTFIKNGFTYAVLTNEQITFLKEYTPEDDMFTSTEEMSMIKSTLGVEKGMSDILRTAIRNSVVQLYSTLMHTEDGERTEGFREYLNGMQSVTAVIDSIIY